jgi:predicted transcriptional regulator
MKKDRRVEVLFDEKDYRELEERARVKHRSVGALIREAVAEYVIGPSREEKRKALEWMAAQSGPVGSPEEIKADIIRSITEGIEKSLEVD